MRQCAHVHQVTVLLLYIDVSPLRNATVREQPDAPHIESFNAVSYVLERA